MIFNMYMRLLLLTMLAFLKWPGLVAQHGPALMNYTVADYKAHNQNWSITQSASKVIFCGNTDGMLVCNGNAWHLYRLPSGKIVRSVHASGTRIYSGAYAEIGFWQADECGRYVYTDLTPQVPKSWIEKEEIWNIVQVGDDIYFQSFSLLLKYDGRKMEKVGLPGSIMFLHKVGNRLLIQSLGFGIYEIFPDHIEMLPGTAFFSDKTVVGITAWPARQTGTLLIATGRHGLFTMSPAGISTWRADLKEYFVNVQINRTLLTQEGWLALGTIRDGLLLFSPDGTLQHHLFTANGLQNNTVIAMYEDMEGQLWLGLDRGICVVRVHDPIQYFTDVTGAIGTVYTMARHENQLYVGTNQGLYMSSEGGQFSLVKGTQGQVWELLQVDGQLLCGHNEGTFRIRKNQATKISSVTGGWYFSTVPGRDDWMLQGTYTGIVVYRRKGGEWLFSHKIKGYNQPVKKLLFGSQNTLWVAGPNTGVAYLTIDASFTQVVKVRDFSGPQGGLPENLNADLSVFDGKICVFDGVMHYLLDTAEWVFRPDEWLNAGPDKYLIRRSKQRDDSAWYAVYHDSIVRMSGRERQQSIFLKGNRDYHGISYLGDGKTGFSLHEGYAVMDERSASVRPEEKNGFQASIEILPSGRCLPFVNGKGDEIRFSENSFRLHFSDADFRKDKVYQVRILPLSKEWRPCSAQGYTDFDNLPAGKYVIELKRTGRSDVWSFPLRVNPPWYRSTPAFLFYLFLIGAGVYWMIRYFNHRLLKEKLRLAAENERFLREHTIQMENDRLLQDNLTKSRELANATMHLIQKNVILEEIKEEINAIRKTGDQVLTAKDFQLIMRQINENLTKQEDKNLFDHSFNEVHEQFFKKLKKDFPTLSGADLQLAAYIKMNLSSKEIAPLFHISLRGLENKRYRLRKKLGLNNDDSLADFFLNNY